jgi:hypothetical protein
MQFFIRLIVVSLYRNCRILVFNAKKINYLRTEGKLLCVFQLEQVLQGVL